MGNAMWIQVLLALSMVTPHPAPVKEKPAWKAAAAQHASVPAVVEDRKLMEAAVGKGGYAGGKER